MMLQFQLLEGNLKAVRGEMEQMLFHIEELGRAKMTLEELGGVKADSSAMVPIGVGMFVRGKITGVSDVLIRVGSGDVAVVKSREDALKYAEEHLEETRKLAERLAEQERVVVAELQRLQPVIQRLLQR